MENTPYLYDTLVRVLSHHAHWLDLCHLKTLAWMMVGLINSYSISLGAWTPFVISRARYSQSTVRRFRRWLDNDKIEVQTLYGPLIQQALGGWVGKRLSVALDTSMLWDTYCTLVRDLPRSCRPRGVVCVGAWQCRGGLYGLQGVVG